MEESDSEDLNKETEGENNEDEIRVATENENEEIIGMMRKTMKKKTKDCNPKEKKLRNNASEDEDDTESEEELKKYTRSRLHVQDEFHNFVWKYYGNIRKWWKPTKLLNCIKDEDDIAKIDWYDYILDCLRTSKLNWKDVKTKKNFYYGPLTFLCLIYLDSTFFPNLNIIYHRLAIRSWNTMMMRKRIKMEKSQRCLGSLEHHGEFDPEEEQNGIDLYKGLDVYIEPLSDRIPVTKESSKDEDSDNDSDPDNDNNKDDEEEPMADGKNQNENERQSEIQKEKDFVFETKDEAATIRDYMQTLAPQLKVEFNVIDTFSIVLNHEQKMNSKGKKIKYFFHTSMITKDMFKWKKANGEYDKEKQFEAFSKTIKSEFKKDPEMKNMRDLEMKKLFSMHLEKVDHPRAKDVLNKKTTIVKWGTKENDIDCVVNPFPLGMGMWYDGEPLWGSSDLGGYLVVEGLLRIAPLSFYHILGALTGNLGCH
ncbi:hypothetical protein Tco_1174399 [Tanacetum coccineum]